MRLGLGHGGAIDRMNEPISGALGRLTARCGQAFLTIRAELLTHYRRALARLRLWLRPELSHAIAAAARQIAETVDLSAVVCWTFSGSTVLRMARERLIESVLFLAALCFRIVVVET